MDHERGVIADSVIGQLTFSENTSSVLARIQADGQVIIHWPEMETTASDGNHPLHHWAKIVIAAREEGRTMTAQPLITSDNPS